MDREHPGGPQAQVENAPRHLQGSLPRAEPPAGIESRDRPVPTIDEAYRIWYVPWLDRRVSDGKAKENPQAYSICWSNVVAPEWSGIPVDSVQPERAQRWLLALSAGNTNHAIVILCKVPDFAVQCELAKTNKFRLPYEMPVRKAVTRRTGTFDLTRADAVFMRLRGSIAEAAYILACFGSVRTSESLGVRPEEVAVVESNGTHLCPIRVGHRLRHPGNPQGPHHPRRLRQALSAPNRRQSGRYGGKGDGAISGQLGYLKIFLDITAGQINFILRDS